MKILIVDDNWDNRRQISNVLNTLPFTVVTIESSNAEDALFKILEEQPEIVIAESNLPNRSGFELASAIHAHKFPVHFIVYSSYEADAVKAIHNNVFDFLFQPISAAKLTSSVLEIATSLERKTDSDELHSRMENVLIRINTVNGFAFIEIDNLVYVMADGAYSMLYFLDGSKEFATNYLRKIEEILSSYHFMRISRSVLINLKYLNMIDKRRDLCRLRFNGQEVELKITKSFFKHMEYENLI